MIDCNKIKIYEHADSLEARQSIFNSDDFRCVLTLEHLGLIFGVRPYSLVLDPMARASD